MSVLGTIIIREGLKFRRNIGNGINLEHWRVSLTSEVVKVKCLPL